VTIHNTVWYKIVLCSIRCETSKLRQISEMGEGRRKYRIEWMEWLVLELCTHIHLVRTDAQYPYNVFNIHVYTDTIFKQFSTGLARSTVWRSRFIIRRLACHWKLLQQNKEKKNSAEEKKLGKTRSVEVSS
jgi:hypothetical protein